MKMFEELLGNVENSGLRTTPMKEINFPLNFEKLESEKALERLRRKWRNRSK